MNPKNPQAASEGLRERLLREAGAGWTGEMSALFREAAEAIPAPEDDDETPEPSALQIEYARGYGDGVKHGESLAAPAIAPGGDALRLFDDLLYRLAGQIGDSNADFSHKIVSNYYRELDLIRKALAPAGDVRTPMTTDLTPAGNAVDDAMVRRALDGVLPNGHRVWAYVANKNPDPSVTGREVMLVALAAAALALPDCEVITEHSGCGHGIQNDQVRVSMRPGDKVLLVRARASQ